jgi:hypothetical protein
MLAAMILLLVGGIVADVFVFHQNLTGYPFLDEHPVQHSPGVILVILTSPLLLAVPGLCFRHFADTVSITLIQYFCGWYSAGYHHARPATKTLIKPDNLK